MARPTKGRDKAAIFIVAPPSATPAPDRDQRWKALTAKGNAAHADGRWAEAEGCYAEALAAAETVFAAAIAGTPVAGTDAAPMLVVATANAADNWLMLGQGARAGAALAALCRRLCDVIDDGALPPAVREQRFLQLRPAVMELAGQAASAGLPADTVAEQVDRAKATALRFIQGNSARH